MTRVTGVANWRICKDLNFFPTSNIYFSLECCIKLIFLSTQTRCNSLENRVEETHRQMASLREELSAERQTSSSARRDIQSLEMEKTHDKDKLMRLENQVKEFELEKQKLVNSYTTNQVDALLVSLFIMQAISAYLPTSWDFSLPFC